MKGGVYQSDSQSVSQSVRQSANPPANALRQVSTALQEEHNFH